MRKKTVTSFLATVYFAFFAVLFSSCNSSRKINYDYIYFRNGVDTATVQKKERIIETGDLLSIQVYSTTLNQEQATVFNIPNTGASGLQGYQVSIEGTIDMPVIGKVKAAGLSKDSLQSVLTQNLTYYVKAPSVLVRFLGFDVNVLGEVRLPGARKFLVDNVTVIDAISAAGDLTDNGKREDVTVIREKDGKRMYYTVDLRSKSLFGSQGYTLQPNDIVYVKPNLYKLKTLSVDPEVQRQRGLLFTIASFVLGIASFFFYLVR